MRCCPTLFSRASFTSATVILKATGRCVAFTNPFVAQVVEPSLRRYQVLGEGRDDAVIPPNSAEHTSTTAWLCLCNKSCYVQVCRRSSRPMEQEFVDPQQEALHSHSLRAVDVKLVELARAVTIPPGSWHWYPASAGECLHCLQDRLLP